MNDNRMLTDAAKSDILIVDDVPDNLRLLSILLQRAGFRVRQAINGQIALTAAQTQIPDLILLDITMPEMDGYEVCSRLKQNPQTKEVPIIFLSALDETWDKVKAFQSGGVDYITKPFSGEEVLARIRSQLTIQALQKDLRSQNQRLTQTLHELHVAQGQLLQREKMASLGRLAAGMSHEINNPVNFILGNLSPLRKYSQVLFDLLHLYQREYMQPSKALQQALEDSDLDFLATDLHKIQDSIERGATRIQSIVTALRVFAHLDESEVKAINLHNSLESTLALLQHRLMGKETDPAIAVSRHYGQLPLVTCHVQPIHQALLNLLENSIDALWLKHQHDQSFTDLQIAITTSSDAQGYVEIRVRDNGCGITAENLQHIFDPFFTTKTIGQGMGLGLATSYQIVNAHRGTLTCDSAPDWGSEFILRLPIAPP